MSENQIKTTIRQACIRKRKKLTWLEQQTASDAVCKQIQSLPQYQQATHVGIYSPIQGEIDLSLLKKDNKIICFPQIQSDQTLVFLPIEETTEFKKNQFGIMEPNLSILKNTPLVQLDIVFFPLVAFDQTGTRIGMGGGYYDRTFSKNPPTLRIGVGYEFQKQTYIPREPWDVTLDAVITEANIYKFI